MNKKTAKLIRRMSHGRSDYLRKKKRYRKLTASQRREFKLQYA